MGRRDPEDPPGHRHLTPREREVLDALAAGLDSHAIADQLKISIRTERNHVARNLLRIPDAVLLSQSWLADRSEITNRRCWTDCRFNIQSC